MKDITELTKHLGNKDHVIRRSAVELLGSTEDETVIEALIPLLKDENRFVRQEAVLALKNIGGSKVVEHLTQALSTEKNEFVIDFIKKALERLQKEQSTSR
jgi:HEAT repeat protein